MRKDKLTGLYSKEYMFDDIDKRLKQASQMCIGLLDIDFFTNINEKIGQTNGDQVIQNIADALPRQSSLTIGRYESDEFIFVFEGLSEQAVLEYAKSMKEKFRHSRFIPVFPYEKARITFSMGIAMKTQEIHTSFQLIKAAEIALLQAKKQGRNRIIPYKNGGIKSLSQGKISYTVIGNQLKGNAAEGESAFTAAIAEPYGVEIDRDDQVLFVDRSNHCIKKIIQKKVYTIAGNNLCSYGGDGEEATKALLCKPSGICVDRFGCYYIADTGNHRIRKIEGGYITTVAGCGESGYSGDGGSAITARLNRPGGIVVDGKGNLYTNDYANNVIRKIDTYGIITTIVGNGGYGYSGDNKKAIDAEIDKPYGLCVDESGSKLYIADYGNHCIREVDNQTGIISTLCGTGEPGYSGDHGDCTKATLNGPFWVSLYGNNLLIADSNNHCIRSINLLTKIITTLVGDGIAGFIDSDSDITQVRLNVPAGMVAKAGTIYIADYGNNAIRCVKI